MTERKNKRKGKSLLRKNKKVKAKKYSAPKANRV
jgi:hypothetical protein